MLAVATTHPNHYTTLLKSAEWDSHFSLTIFKLTESQQVMSLKRGKVLKKYEKLSQILKVEKKEGTNVT